MKGGVQKAIVMTNYFLRKVLFSLLKYYLVLQVTFKNLKNLDFVYSNNQYRSATDYLEKA
jgi:hypothetical protein